MPGSPVTPQAPIADIAANRDRDAIHSLRRIADIPRYSIAASLEYVQYIARAALSTVAQLKAEEESNSIAARTQEVDRALARVQLDERDRCARAARHSDTGPGVTPEFEAGYALAKEEIEAKIWSGE